MFSPRTEIRIDHTGVSGRRADTGGSKRKDSLCENFKDNKLTVKNGGHIGGEIPAGGLRIDMHEEQIRGETP